MSYQAEVLKVLIASPSDVGAERVAIPEVIYSWNAVNSEELKVVLLPIMWETHSTPEIGDRPQAIINKQLVSHCDILVGTFWTRIGTHTGVAESGTVEEINEFIEAEKPVLLYFSSQPIVPESIDIKQYKRLSSFKKEMYDKGLVEQYSSIPEFRDKLGRHLTNLVRRISKEVILPQGEETPSTQDKLTLAKEQLYLFLDRSRMLWKAEKDSNPIRINTGKRILLDFGSQLVEFSQLLKNLIDPSVNEEIQQVITNTRKIQTHQVYMDGGISYRQFWEHGDNIISQAQTLAEKI